MHEHWKIICRHLDEEVAAASVAWASKDGAKDFAVLFGELIAGCSSKLIPNERRVFVEGENAGIVDVPHSFRSKIPVMFEVAM